MSDRLRGHRGRKIFSPRTPAGPTNPYGHPAERAKFLASRQRLRDLGYRINLVAADLTLLGLFYLGMPGAIIIPISVFLTILVLIVAFPGDSTSWEREAGKATSPELARALLVEMHRAHSPAEIIATSKLVMASMSGIRSRKDLHVHEWETIAAITLDGPESIAREALEILKKHHVEVAVPVLRYSVQFNKKKSMRKIWALVEAIEGAIDHIQATNSRDAGGEYSPTIDPQGWPDRDLGWFHKSIRHRAALLALNSLARIGTMTVFFLIFGLEPFGALLAGIFVGYFWDVFARTGEKVEWQKRIWFPVDNVPGSVFVRALRRVPARGVIRFAVPLHRYIESMAAGATDFSPLHKDDWEFLLERLETEPDFVALKIAQAVGGSAPLTFLPAVESRYQNWLSSQSRSAPMLLERLMRAKLLLRSRGAVPAAPPHSDHS